MGNSKPEFKAAVGLSREWDARKAGREVAINTLNKLGAGVKPDFFLLFSTIIFSGISDEIGNTWADKRVKIKLVKEAIGRIYPKDKFQYRLAERFFMHRFAMKIAILFLAVLKFFSYLYFFAFMLFDLMYLLVERYSFSIKVYSINKPMVVK